MENKIEIKEEEIKKEEERVKIEQYIDKKKKDGIIIDIPEEINIDKVDENIEKIREDNKIKEEEKDDKAKGNCANCFIF